MPTPDARTRTATLVLCCVAQFMVILDVSIVNVALPAIREDLDFDPADLQWVVSAYTLVFAGFLLLGGRAADLLGRREVFAFGLAFFALASLVGGFATSEGQLVAARAAQGLGGAIVAPATLSILTTTFTEGAERNRALGLWGAMGGVGGATGALVGGVLVEALSWRWILFVNVPVGAIGAVAALRIVAAGRRVPENRRQFDLAGALSVTAGLIALTFGIVSSEQHGWGSARTLVPLGVGAALLALFGLVEGRLASRPLVPLRIFASRQLSGANVVVFAMGSAAFAMWYFVSLYSQQVLGLSPIETGLAFLPMTAIIVVCSRLASTWVSRFGPGPVLAGGMTALAAGMALFTGLSADGSYLGDVLVPSLFAAAGIGFSFVPVTIAATSGVDGSEAGLASGLVNTSRQVGGSLGLALLATLAVRGQSDAGPGTSEAQALTEGFTAAFAVGAVFAAVGAVVALAVLVRGVARPAPVTAG